MTTLSLEDVRAARRRIDAHVLETPLVPSAVCPARLKLECLQPTGAFKVRGAANKVLQLSEEARARGVVTLSTGNHGRAVAWIAKKLGVRAVVCMSRRVPDNKRRAIEALGAEIRIEGDSQDEAGVLAHRLAEVEGLTVIPPFDDPAIIAGQGTIALEILDQWPEVDTIVAPLSGGGLVAGIAAATAASNPRVRVVAVSAARAPVMLKSLEAGRPVEMPEVDTIADSLLGGIGDPNRYTLDLVRSYVGQHVVVDEAEIEAAMAAAFEEDGLVLEGAGAAGIAAVAAGEVSGARVAVVASGRNVDRATLVEMWRGTKEKENASQAAHGAGAQDVRRAVP